MSTQPHPLVDDPDANSRTAQFMGPRLREFEEAQGREATHEDRFKIYREYDDYKTKRFVKWATVAAGAITTIGGAVFAVLVMFKAPETKPADVLEKVEDEAAVQRKANEKAATVNAHNIGTLAEIAVEQQQLTVEVADHIGAKIDAAHPRQADALGKVKKPPSLKNAEAELEDRKKKAAAGSLLEKLPAPDEK